MTPRDKELANEFINLARWVSVSNHNIIWSGSNKKINCYDFTYTHVHASYKEFTYEQDKGLWYRETPLALSWWMRCKVYWAAKRLADFGDAVVANTLELERQKLIAE